MNHKLLEYNTIKSGDVQDKAFIMIHGWQGNKNSFTSIPKLLNISNCTWFFPEAPYSVDGKIDKKTWAIEKSPGVWEIEEPRAMLRAFILDVVLSKFDAKNTYVMGFSQGAAVCYELILSFEYTLGGIFPIAGFVRDFPGQRDKVEVQVSPAQKDTPVLIGHGKDDDIVLVEASYKAYELLKKECRNIELHIYNGRHKIGLDYLKKVEKLVLKEKLIKNKI